MPRVARAVSSRQEIYLDLIDELSPGVIKDRRTILVRPDAGETLAKRPPDRGGGGSFDEVARVADMLGWELVNLHRALCFKACVP
jgi:hypothetical protein